VDGNREGVRKYKRELCDWIERLSNELTQELKFEQFAQDITKELTKQSEFETLRQQEKDLNLKIKKVNEEERKAREEADR
jgi:4-alpha-glucanotransferase